MQIGLIFHRRQHRQVVALAHPPDDAPHVRAADLDRNGGASAPVHRLMQIVRRNQVSNRASRLAPAIDRQQPLPRVDRECSIGDLVFLALVDARNTPRDMVMHRRRLARQADQRGDREALVRRDVHHMLTIARRIGAALLRRQQAGRAEEWLQRPHDPFGHVPPDRQGIAPSMLASVRPRWTGMRGDGVSGSELLARVRRGARRLVCRSAGPGRGYAHGAAQVERRAHIGISAKVQRCHLGLLGSRAIDQQNARPTARGSPGTAQSSYARPAAPP